MISLNRLSAIALLLATAIAPLTGQCPDCPKAAGAKAGIKATVAAQSKPVRGLLFNEVCPITGKATSAKTPTVAWGDYQISLCCAGCESSFADLEAVEKTAFVARFTGKDRRTGFPVATTAATSKSTCCCEEMTSTKPEASCCAETAAPKAEAKASCCDETAAPKAEAPNAEAKASCCDETAAPKAEAKASCCAETAAPKAEAKASCCAETAAPNAEAPNAEAPNAEAPNAEAKPGCCCEEPKAMKAKAKTTAVPRRKIRL